MKKILFVLLSAVISHTISAQGLTKNGQLTSTPANYINTNGAIGVGGVTKNGALIAGSTLNALNIDGINDNVTIPSSSSLNIGTTITIEAWVYPMKNSGSQNVISKSSCSMSNGYIFPRTDDGWANFSIHLYTGGSWKIVSSAFPSLNTWHHLAATYDGANIKLYLDGALVKTQAETGAIALNTNALCLGDQPGCSEYFGGTLDEVRIWNTARTQSEIQNAMNAELAGNEAGLAAYYNFNQGIAGGANTGVITLIDKTSNANHGTLNSFTLSGAISNWVAGTPYALDGLTTFKASSSAYAIKQAYPSSPDGYYWIKNSSINSGTPFQIYADMTTNGGGWTLIMCNTNPNSGWTSANAVLRNETTPSNNANYSIIAWADYIKKSSSGFQYMMDANTRGNYGGIWTANQPYSFVSRVNTNTDIMVNIKFGAWNYFEGGGFGQRMPWWTTNTTDGLITTSLSGNGYWWGTLVTQAGWGPSPWLSGDGGTLSMQNPGIIWYWVR